MDVKKTECKKKFKNESAKKCEKPAPKKKKEIVDAQGEFQKHYENFCIKIMPAD